MGVGPHEQIAFAHAIGTHDRTQDRASTGTCDTLAGIHGKRAVSLATNAVAQRQAAHEW
jgi:hypothetical protein